MPFVKNNNELIFPRAFAFAIDDLGWNTGSSMGAKDAPGPYRTGINKQMEQNDYRAIVEVGETMGVRIQALFVLCDMDRTNVCSKYPSTTMYGKDWDNSKNICDEQIEIMKYVKDNAAFLEFGMHGVGHELWPEKMHKVRAEWYNREDKKPWPEEFLNDHIQCFKEIMSQYGLTPENGQSFPESFVPGSYSYYWNPQGEYSLGKLLQETGVKYANTDFSFITEQNPPGGGNGGGFDHGVHVINRINYGNEWWRLGALPLIPLEIQESDIIESHWANWLAQDYYFQPRVTNLFINYYRMVQASPTRYMAKNTEQLHSQWLYNKYTRITDKLENSLTIDNTAMPDEVYQNDLLGNMVLKIKLNNYEHISSASIDQQKICCYHEESGYAFLYLPVLKKKTYTLVYSIGSQLMDDCIVNDGTYNIYSFEKSKNVLKFTVKMYGSQSIKLKCAKPESIDSSNKYLEIKSSAYNEAQSILSIKVSGRDFQGEKGIITLNY
jgi:hypothetical protein